MTTRSRLLIRCSWYVYCFNVQPVFDLDHTGLTGHAVNFNEAVDEFFSRAEAQAEAQDLAKSCGSAWASSGAMCVRVGDGGDCHWELGVGSEQPGALRTGTSGLA